MHFCWIFGLSKLLTVRENGSQKGITRKKFSSQNHSPDGNLALKITYQMRIWPSHILNGHDYTFFNSARGSPDLITMNARLRQGEFLASPACTICGDIDIPEA